VPRRPKFPSEPFAALFREQRPAMFRRSDESFRFQTKPAVAHPAPSHLLRQLKLGMILARQQLVGLLVAGKSLSLRIES